MNCCNDFGECTRGHDCPARRQRAYPETLPPELPVWPESKPAAQWRARLANLASAAGYAGLIMMLIGGALLSIHAWVTP